jgi:signal transduction histidine kinase
MTVLTEGNEVNGSAVCAGVTGALIGVVSTRALYHLVRNDDGAELRASAARAVHELNNLLTVIAGFNEVLLSSLSEHDPRRADAEEIRNAAQRATDLGERLLGLAGTRDRFAA